MQQYVCAYVYVCLCVCWGNASALYLNKSAKEQGRNGQNFIPFIQRSSVYLWREHTPASVMHTSISALLHYSVIKAPVPPSIFTLSVSVMYGAVFLSVITALRLQLRKTKAGEQIK